MDFVRQPTGFELMKDAVARQLPRSSNAASRSRAERFLRDGTIVSPRFGALPYEDGDVWADSTERARARYLHGFVFFADWHGTVLADSSVAGEYAEIALNMVRRWATLHGDGTLLPDVSHHDETTAQRLIQLTAFLLELDGFVPEDDFVWLFELARSTARLLASDGFHSTGNNHGMFQDLALLYFSVACDSIPEDERREYFETSTRRLHTYFSSAFTPDGVHIENTPTYHLMVSKHVHGVLEILAPIGHQHVEYYRSLLKHAAEYATHALMPNGMYPPISDTTQQLESAAAKQNIFESQEFAYAASAGKQGTPPHATTLVLPDSGYAIYRSAWGDPKATFAFFSAAYNANYHKHSDDLSLFLRSAGVDLLSEAGAYGYDYKNPLTKFAYSSYAHNCLVVDGISLPRTDKSRHLTTLEANEIREDGYTVTGRTERLTDTAHTRIVDIHDVAGVPEIDVTDTVVSQNQHDYELLWNLGPDVQPVVHGQGFELFHKGQKVMDLQFDADVATKTSLHTGESRPKYLGWRFPSFGNAVPAPVVRITFSGRGAQIRTRIRLANFNYLDRGLHNKSLAWNRTKDSVGLNYLSVPARTESGSGKLAVVFSAIHQPGDFTFNYKKSVDESGVHALYILDDFGDQGSYYLADHGDRSIFKSVQGLIGRELSRLGLTSADLITVGSSKGASAAIVHGIAAGAGRILAGAPQVKIGSFLRKPHPNMLRFIMGDTSDSSVAGLDRVIFEAIDDLSQDTRLSILVGEGDHHYRNHVLPLAEHAVERSKNLQLTVLPGLPHAEIGGVFRGFLSANIHQEILGSGEEALPYVLQSSQASPGALSLQVHLPTNSEIACRLYRGSNLVARTPYSDDANPVWEGLSPGRYRVRLFPRSTKDDIVRPFTTKWCAVT